jgi:hypothetical protein
MPRSRISRIRDHIRQRQYDMSAHAMEEMAEDDLDIEDVEHALLTGAIRRIERDDPRGVKYVVQGLAVDGVTLVGIVGRFASRVAPQNPVEAKKTEFLRNETPLLQEDEIPASGVEKLSFYSITRFCGAT